MQGDHPQRSFDVIVVGGSYSGLAAGMALGRSLKQVLIIDGGSPCNRQTPHSHNFLTHDGRSPNEIAQLAKAQVERYTTVSFFKDLVIDAERTAEGFNVRTQSGQIFTAKKLIFATGIKDVMPDIEGFAECWGISVLHCPYCHGYEVRNEETGIIANGEVAFEFTTLISNWTKRLTLFTNGKSLLTAAQTAKLKEHNIVISEKEIARLEHVDGYVKQVIFKDDSTHPIKALYGRVSFEQHCRVTQTLGCEMTDDGYIKVDSLQQTTISGVFACGDNTTRMRTVANAVSTGAIAGMMANKDLIFERF